MISKDDIIKRAGDKNIEYINIIPYDFEGYRSVLVAVLPYYSGELNSRISKYARGLDYHKVGYNLLTEILTGIEHKILIDVSPLNERELAIKAGLGVKGDNNLLINEKYGSYVFIITALLKIEAEEIEYKTEECIHCGMCVKACPVDAINNLDNCLSHITQKRSITYDEEMLIKKHNKVWGCDICQDVCPMNKDICLSPIKEFRKELVLNISDIFNITNSQFKKEYSKNAFSYRGKNVIRRNIALTKNNNF